MKRDDPMNVLIAGGGVAALEAALALRALAEERVRVELLAPEHHFFYRPLAVAEPFELGRVERFDLAELAAEAWITRAEAHPVASALLRALGLPQSAELPPPPAGCRWPAAPARVATYGTPADRAATAREGKEYLEGLRSLGYL